MNARFLFPPAAGNSAAVSEGLGGKAAAPAAEPGDSVDYACCCPAKPAVRVVMPPSPSRPHSTELLLCGHHYRVSRAALAAAQAVVCGLPDTSPDIASWVGIEPDISLGCSLRFRIRTCVPYLQSRDPAGPTAADSTISMFLPEK